MLTVLESVVDSDLSLKVNQVKAQMKSDEFNYVDIICKNYQQMFLEIYSTLQEEEMGMNYQSVDLSERHLKMSFMWYLIIKAADLFWEKNGRYPGEKVGHDKFDLDVPFLKECMEIYLKGNDRIKNMPFGCDEIVDDYFF